MEVKFQQQIYVIFKMKKNISGWKHDLSLFNMLTEANVIWSFWTQ